MPIRNFELVLGVLKTNVSSHRYFQTAENQNSYRPMYSHDASSSLYSILETKGTGISHEKFPAYADEDEKIFTDSNLQQTFLLVLQ